MRKLYWQVITKEGEIRDEPPEDGSIIYAPEGSVEIRVCTEKWDSGLLNCYLRTPIIRVDLHDELGDLWRPIFYRKRYTDMDGFAEVKTSAVVFGKAREGRTNKSAIDVSLFAFTGVGKAINCPPDLVDLAMIQHQVVHAEVKGIVIP